MLHSDRLAARIATATKVGPKAFRPISSADANALGTALIDDARRVSQVAVASLFEGVSGAATGRYTWAKVKLYYSAFYAVRAMLMLHGFSIFYLGRSPFSLKAQAGLTVEKRSGNSHTVAIEMFTDQFPANPVVTQTIDTSSPLEWLEEQRNVASYRSAPLLDPQTPKEFVRFADRPRAHLQAYLGLDGALLAFDSDHAMIALPIQLILELSGLMSARSMSVDISQHFIGLLSSQDCYVPDLKKELVAFSFS